MLKSHKKNYILNHIAFTLTIIIHRNPVPRNPAFSHSHISKLLLNVFLLKIKVYILKN